MPPVLRQRVCRMLTRALRRPDEASTVRTAGRRCVVLAVRPCARSPGAGVCACAWVCACVCVCVCACVCARVCVICATTYNCNMSDTAQRCVPRRMAMAPTQRSASLRASSAEISSAAAMTGAIESPCLLACLPACLLLSRPIGVLCSEL